MDGSRFGTDGVRGTANSAVSVELATAVGAATASVFGGERVFIARDTRRSGPMLEAAAAAGVAAAGVDAGVLGVAPTPAVAAMCREQHVAGIVVSASHNPYADNGLKVFAPGGRKLTDDQQVELERLIDSWLADGEAGAASRSTGAEVGDVSQVDPAEWMRHYDAHARSALGGRSLDGLTVVIDCAHGANSVVAETVMRAAGASVQVIGADPDGMNINDGVGSTAPELLSRTVRSVGADLGIAFDGDADRVLAVDENGDLVTGDHLLALLAIDLRDRGALAGDTLVVTVMSNLGLHNAMASEGIDVVETPVGDRSVLAALDAGGYSLGGEQSGHIVMSDLATTGDGLLAALAIADLLNRSDQTMSELAAAAMTVLPQVLVNVAIAAPMPDVVDRISEDIAVVSDELGDSGRVLVRPSGTEPVVRVMVEASLEPVARRAAERLATAVSAADSLRTAD